MMIVDAQVYVWAAYTLERPWPEDGLGREHGLIPMMSDALLTQMDETGINCGVIVPPSWEGDYDDLAIKAATDDPDHFAIMIFLFWQVYIGGPSPISSLNFNQFTFLQLLV